MRAVATLRAALGDGGVGVVVGDWSGGCAALCTMRVNYMDDSRAEIRDLAPVAERR